MKADLKSKRVAKNVFDTSSPFWSAASRPNKKLKLKNSSKQMGLQAKTESEENGGRDTLLRVVPPRLIRPNPVPERDKKPKLGKIAQHPACATLKKRCGQVARM